MRFPGIALFLVAIVPVAAFAQGAAPRPYQFTIEDYARAERLLGATMTK